MTAAETARDLVLELPGWAGRTLAIRPGVVPMASPMNQGVDADAWRITDSATGDSLWVRLPHLDAALFSCPRTLVAAATAAAEAGVGPVLHYADPASGAIVLADLSATHKTATLDRLAEPAVRDAVLAAKRLLHQGPDLPRRADVFQAIEALLDRATAAGIALPPDSAWLIDNIRAAAAAIAAVGADLVPAHGDGNASNVLIDQAGQVLLVDMDMAGMMDPLQDFGSLLSEIYPFDPGACECFEAFFGRFDERLFNRARLYGVADDLRWGLIGAILARTSRRTALEFLKYADWRYLRARLAMRDPRFEERLRRL